jgi:hypothetical protein
MTIIIMNLKRDCDMGQHLALVNVLNQIIALFSGEDEQQEELVAMMASA